VKRAIASMVTQSVGSAFAICIALHKGLRSVEVENERNART
jgi:hypothetical protein